MDLATLKQRVLRMETDSAKPKQKVIQTGMDLVILMEMDSAMHLHLDSSSETQMDLNLAMEMD